MKPTKTFKLGKRNKTILALSPFKDQDTRDAFRRMMIDATLCASVIIKREKRPNIQPGPEIE